MAIVLEGTIRPNCASPISSRQWPRRCQAEEPVRRHPRPGHPGPPPLRVVRHGRGVHRAGAGGPEVLAIKMTLYRTAANPHRRRAGARGRERQAGDRPGRAAGAARRGEQHRQGPACSRRPASTSSTGIVGLKTHCKALLVVRREQDGIRRYVHLATGNYNPTTARLYTDLSLFTCRPEFGEDATRSSTC